MIEPRVHFYYGQLEEVVPFLHQAKSHCNLEEAHLLIKISNDTILTTKSSFLTLPYSMAYYEKRGCKVPKHHLSSTVHSDMKPEQKFSTSFVVTPDFEPCIEWVDEIASTLKSQEVEFFFEFKVIELDDMKPLVLNKLTLYVSEKSDLELFHSHVLTDGIKSDNLINEIMPYSKLIVENQHQDQVTKMISSHPTSLCDLALNLNRPNLRNKFGYTTYLESIPSFDGSPMSLWVGEEAQEFCCNYIQNIIDNNIVNYIGVASTNVMLPNFNGLQTTNIFTQTLDSIALLDIVAELYSEIDRWDEWGFARHCYDLARSKIKEEFGLIGYTETCSEMSNLMREFDYLIANSEYIFNSTTNLVVKLIDICTEKDLNIDSELLNRFVNNSIGDYVPIAHSLSVNKIVIEHVEDNQSDTNVLAYLLAMAKSEIEHHKSRAKRTFNNVCPISLVHLNLTNDQNNKIIEMLLRRSRKAGVATFAVMDDGLELDREKNPSRILQYPRSFIIPTANKYEFEVRDHNRTIIVNAEVI